MIDAAIAFYFMGSPKKIPPAFRPSHKLHIPVFFIDIGRQGNLFLYGNIDPDFCNKQNLVW